MNYSAVNLILTATVLFVLAGIVEKLRHRKNLREIPIRIMVNGTRGKTSVTRLIAAILREAGIRTWAKTTGTQAAWILPDGSEMEYRKKRPVNIREQIPFIRRARRDRAEAVVIECMALHPESQRMMAEEFVRPTIEVITNARVDHVTEIGATEQETVDTLALSIHPSAQVVADDARFDAYTDRRADSTGVEVDDGYLSRFSFPMFAENVRQALKVAELLKIDREVALRGMLKARPDVGMCGPFQVGSCLVVNAFAANDLDSSRALFEKMVRERELAGRPVWLLFNNRGDREFRLSEFAPLVRELSARGAQLRVIGENAAKVARYFAKHAGAQAQQLEEAPLKWLEDLGEKPCVVLCLGNIRGVGRELIEALEARKLAEQNNGAASEADG